MVKVPFMNINRYLKGSWEEEMLARLDTDVPAEKNVKIDHKKAEQIIALLNAVIHRKELRDELVDNSKFWLAMRHLTKYCQSKLPLDKEDKVVEAFVRAGSILISNSDMEEISAHEDFTALYYLMLELAQPSTTPATLSLPQIYARKGVYNLKSKNKLGDHLLPLTDNCYDSEGDGKRKLNVVFVQGVQQHPLRVWSAFKKSNRNSAQ